MADIVVSHWRLPYNCHFATLYIADIGFRKVQYDHIDLGFVIEAFHQVVDSDYQQPCVSPGLYINTNMPNKTNHEGISKLLTKLFAIVQRIYNHNKYLKLRMLLVLGYYEILNFFSWNTIIVLPQFYGGPFQNAVYMGLLTHDGTDWSDGTGTVCFARPVCLRGQSICPSCQ